MTNNVSGRILNLFGPNIIIVAVYFFLLMLLFMAYGVKFELSHFKLWSIFLSTLFVIYVTSTLIQHYRRDDNLDISFAEFASRKLVRFFLDWFPLIALVTIYENLREYTGIIRTDSIDATLYKMDIMLFGVEPTVWIQKFAHPLLTEYFAFTYSLYLVLPLSLGWLLYVCGRRREFQGLVTAVITCLCAGFLLYLLFPAGPPRFFIADLYDPPTLQGAFGYYNAMQAKFDTVNPMTYRASFPSLHVALSSFALIYIAKFKSSVPFGKLIQLIYAILVISLWIATIYLRHHWIVDVFAGWMLAAFSTTVSSWVQKKFAVVP